MHSAKKIEHVSASSAMLRVHVPSLSWYSMTSTKPISGPRKTGSQLCSWSSSAVSAICSIVFANSLCINADDGFVDCSIRFCSSSIAAASVPGAVSSKRTWTRPTLTSSIAVTETMSMLISSAIASSSRRMVTNATSSSLPMDVTLEPAGMRIQPAAVK